MFYNFAVWVFKLVFRLLNGKPEVIGLENLPQDEPFILAGTHRSLMDPFMVVDAVYPHVIAFMAKDSLFKFKPLGYILRKGHVFPVNRDNPSPATIKHAVAVMNKQGHNLGIFPTGTRYSTQVKGGTALIQSLSKRPIVPFVIQSPIGFKQLISRKKIRIAIGQPIAYEKGVKYNKEKINQVDQQLALAFTALDAQLDPTYTYIPPIKRDANV